MDKKDINIESYDGQDAFYMGTDEEYAQFLKNADIKMDIGSDAEPVANTQRINLNETINIQGVIDRFKKTAGEIESGAKKIKESVVNRMDSLKSKKEADNAEETQENACGDNSYIANKVTDANDKIKDVSIDISQLSRKLDSLNERLNSIEQTGIANKGEQLNAFGNITSEVKSVSDDIAEIKQAIASVSRLNDSVFDLKNTQLNTKNAIVDLETGIKRLKKKCVLGVTVLSILSAIIIGVEIILMLS